MIYFIKKIKNSLIILIKIEWEVYIIKNLKVKLFIKMNILSLKLINIYILKKEVYLKVYKVIILIKIYSYKMPI